MRTEGPKRVKMRVAEASHAATLRPERVRVVHDAPFPDYQGTTDVTPKVEPQALPTADTVLHADVTVRGIPFYTTTNPSGGYTAIIGG